jgi:transposase
MPGKTTNAEAVATIGIDIGKNTFHLIGLDSKGAIFLRQKLSRSQVEARLANMPPCLIGMEAVRPGTSPGPTTQSARS